MAHPGRGFIEPQKYDLHEIMMSRLRRRRLLQLVACGLLPNTMTNAVDETRHADIQLLVDKTDVGEVLVIPGGTYTFSAALIIRKSIRLVTNSVVHFINVTPNSPIIEILADNVTIDGLAIIGLGKNASKKNVTDHADAIKIGDRKTYVSNIAIHNVTFKNIGDSCVAIEGGDRKGQNFVHDVEVVGCTMRGVKARNNYHSGIYAHGCERLVVIGCDIAEFGQCILTTASTRHVSITDNVLHGTSKQHGIYLSGSTANVVIRRNEINDVQGTGIKCSSPHTVITDNRINRPGVWGINLKADLSDVLIENNVIVDAGNDGIDSGFEGSGRLQKNIKIYDNQIINSGDFGINFAHDKDGCAYSNIRIINNLIQSAKSGGIRFRWNNVIKAVTENILIEGNKISDCEGVAISVGRNTAKNPRQKLELIDIIKNIVTSESTTIQDQIVIIGARDVTVRENVMNIVDVGKMPIRIVDSVDIQIGDNKLDLLPRQSDKRSPQGL